MTPTCSRPGPARAGAAAGRPFRPRRRQAALAFLLAGIGAAAAPAGGDWSSYLGDGGAHYSPLREISRRNVAALAPAWTYHTGDAAPNSQIQCNPLVIDGILYGTSPQHKLFALDAATGRELWRFDPFANGELTAGEGSSRRTPGGKGVNRGLAFWTAGGERRILYTASHYLHAIDPATGQRIDSFGEHGRVDLLAGLDRDVHDLFLVGTTPGAIYRDLIIVSTRVGEGPGPAAPGHICAYDVRTGKRRWIFHTIPWPGEFGYDTWSSDSWQKTGGANCWGGLVVDQERGLAFVPTGSAAFDFWGGNRIGNNLFADCLVALDAATGRRKWHFQFVHHDLWDRDLPSAPALCEVMRNGRRIAAVAQITKSGQVWVFDRETGESLFPWEERAVPPSELKGEAASPTQPFPLEPAPFARQRFTPDEVTDISPAAHDAVTARLLGLPPQVPFSPPSQEGVIILPGFDGGGEWGGAAVDPAGVLYVNGSEMPWVLQMLPTSTAGGPGAALYGQLCVSCHGPERQGNAAQHVPSLVDVGFRLHPADVAALLGTGRGVMPSFAFLRPAQRSALVDFLFGRAPAAGAGEGAGAFAGIPYSTTGYNRFLDPEGHSALRPPWGTLNAIDLSSGQYRWRRPLGEVPELTARGVALTGTENYGGPLVTGGGLVFIAATRDERFRAFDSATGEQLWETRLPAGGYATPATYVAHGTQYVVIACGGGKMETPSGDAYVAFAIGPAPPPAAVTPRGAVPAGVPIGLLRVRLVDESGRLTPGRAWVEDAGRRRLFRPAAPASCAVYPPDRSFSCDGTFELAAPGGPAVVHVEKGKEFTPVDEAVAVKVGETRDVTIVLRRWIDLAARGYYSADLHVHFGSDNPAVLRQLSLADDVNLVPAFSYWWRGDETTWPSAWPSGATVTAVDAAHIVTRNNLELERIDRQGDFGGASGAAFLFDLAQPYHGPRLTAHFPTTADFCLRARQESPAGVADLDKPSWPESVIGVALGAYDVAQICHNHYHRSATLPGGWGMIDPLAPDEKDLRDPDELFRRTNAQYYDWLDCGVRLAASGGSAMGVMPEPIGFSRTYAHVEGAFSVESFWAAVKAGRTFATTGPIVTLAVNGHEMGDTIDRRAGEIEPLDVTVNWAGLGSVQCLQLIENGVVIEQAPGVDAAAAESWSRRSAWQRRPVRSGWFAARVLFLAPDGRLRQAHTSPIYVRVDGKPIAFKASAEYMLRWVDRLVERAGEPGRFESAAERAEVLATYRRAREFYAHVRQTATATWGD